MSCPHMPSLILRLLLLEDVTCSTPAPETDYVTHSPVMEYITPAPSVSHIMPSQRLPLPYTMTAVATGVNLETTGVVNPQCDITAVRLQPHRSSDLFLSWASLRRLWTTKYVRNRSFPRRRPRSLLLQLQLRPSRHLIPACWMDSSRPSSVLVRLTLTPPRSNSTMSPPMASPLVAGGGAQ